MSTAPRSSRLDPQLAEALNDHVSVEARSSFLYFSMASWAEVRGLTGFSTWLRAEASGELAHMNQFVDHLNDRGFQATFQALPQPRAEWSDVTVMFEDVVAMEHELAGRIDALIQTSHDKRDHFTGSFLQQFVPQQIADMAEADEILDRLRIVGRDGQGVILIDQELRARAGN
ncbi:MAG: ferritin [Planctomycetes bacterium]|nr:ferritin [Planctomycetota bacterium]